MVRGRVRQVVGLHLVRHARSAQAPDQPSWEWGLTQDAGLAARHLRDAGVLPGNACWFSSTEPKAIATAALLTDVEVTAEDAFREALRNPAWLDQDEFHRSVLDAFARPEVSVRTGWEPLAETRDRVVAAAGRAVDAAEGRDVVLVGHGTAWTMLVAGLTGRGPDVAAWESMRMPDLCILEWPARIVAGWGSWPA